MGDDRVRFAREVGVDSLDLFQVPGRILACFNCASTFWRPTPSYSYCLRLRHLDRQEWAYDGQHKNPLARETDKLRCVSSSCPWQRITDDLPALFGPYIIAAEPSFIEVHDAETGDLVQVIRGENIRLVPVERGLDPRQNRLVILSGDRLSEIFL